MIRSEYRSKDWSKTLNSRVGRSVSERCETCRIQTLQKVLARPPGPEPPCWHRCVRFTHHGDSNWQHMRPFLPSLRRHMSIVLHVWGELWKCPAGRCPHTETSWRCLTVRPLCHHTTRKSADLETQSSTAVRILLRLSETCTHGGPEDTTFPRHAALELGRVALCDQDVPHGSNKDWSGDQSHGLDHLWNWKTVKPPSVG